MTSTENLSSAQKAAYETLAFHDQVFELARILKIRNVSQLLDALFSVKDNHAYGQYVDRDLRRVHGKHHPKFTALKDHAVPTLTALSVIDNQPDREISIDQLFATINQVEAAKETKKEKPVPLSFRQLARLPKLNQAELVVNPPFRSSDQTRIITKVYLLQPPPSPRKLYGSAIFTSFTKGKDHLLAEPATIRVDLPRKNQKFEIEVIAHNLGNGAVTRRTISAPDLVDAHS